MSPLELLPPIGGLPIIMPFISVADYPIRHFVTARIPEELMQSYKLEGNSMVSFIAPISLKRRDQLLIDVRTGLIFEVSRMDVVIYRICRNA